MLIDSVQQGLERVTGKATPDLLQRSKVLVVGAGGVGCELLKNLVMMGVGSIDVLDLDTIDLSNLNRQFLFRREHVGQQKAIVAQTAVSHYEAVSKVTAHFGDVKDSSQFGNSFIEKFDAVLNALDNTSARRHVNRLCLAASVPIIEAGSTGNLGQVLPILGGLTECYECSPPARQKSFPVCTIRSLPEKQEHCIAWAKYLFELLFGPKTDSNLLVDLLEGFQDTAADSSEGVPAAKSFAYKVSNSVFVKDIKAQAELPGAWENRKPPVPVELDTNIEAAPSATGSTSPTSNEDSFRVWSAQEAVQRFANAIVRMKTDRAEDCGKTVFDKDDPLAVEFVTAAACVRMTNFHMQRMCKWKVESIAGSIVPAIASTNAIVAGLQTAQLLHVLRWRAAQRESNADPKSVEESAAEASAKKTTENKKIPDEIRFVWVYQAASGNHILRSTKLEAPNQKCYVCQSIRMAITINSLKEWRLIDFVNTIVKKELGCSEPLVELSSSQKCIYDDEMEDSDAGMLAQSLEEWEVSSGDVLMITDLSQDFQFDAVISVEEMDEKTNPDLFRLEHLSGERRNDCPAEENGAKESDDDELEEISAIETELSGTNHESDDDVLVVDSGMENKPPEDFEIAKSLPSAGARKRCRNDEVMAETEAEGTVPEPKKPRTAVEVPKA